MRPILSCPWQQITTNLPYERDEITKPLSNLTGTCYNFDDGANLSVSANVGARDAAHALATSTCLSPGKDEPETEHHQDIVLCRSACDITRPISTNCTHEVRSRKTKSTVSLAQTGVHTRRNRSVPGTLTRVESNAYVVLFPSHTQDL